MRRWRWRGCDGDGVDGGGGAACAPRQCPSGAPLFALLDPTPLGLPTRTRAIRKTRFAFSAFRATEITGARKKEVPKNGSVQYRIMNCGPKNGLVFCTPVRKPFPFCFDVFFSFSFYLRGAGVSVSHSTQKCRRNATQHAMTRHITTQRGMKSHKIF